MKILIKIKKIYLFVLIASCVNNFCFVCAMDPHSQVSQASLPVSPVLCAMPQLNRWRMWVSDTLEILKSAVRDAAHIAAFSASSPYVVDEIVAHAPPGNTLEVGAGPGPVTRELVRRLFPDPYHREAYRLDVVEYTPRLFAKLEERLGTYLHHQQHSLARADFVEWNSPIGAFNGAGREFYDTVISTIPFVTLPLDVIQSIFTKIHGYLKPGGQFMYISLLGARTLGKARAELGLFLSHPTCYGDNLDSYDLYYDKLRFIDEYIAAHYTQRTVLVKGNIPPMWVYVCTKRA